MSAPDVATEAVADVADEVAEQATHVAEVSRGLSGRDVGLVFGGLAVGAGLGGTLAFIFAQRKLEAKYNQIAAEEIAEMREHYNQKAVALEAESGKGDLREIVRDRGYVPEPAEKKDVEPKEVEEGSASPPMAVTPPTAVVDRAQEVADEEEAEVPPEANTDPEPEVRNIFQDNPPPEDDWDWHKERSQRSPMRPYVIHREERDEQEAYDGVTFTYYDADDVVCNEQDEVLTEADRERVIGEANLEKFGHGSGDSSIVYVRNDRLEMDVEVVRSPNSYAEEVHGFEPEIKHSDRRERKTFDDE
jgi:hypothetical protein